ncbi:formate dehydrogenase subunit gamma [Actinoallomurus bryophytorum]|uniref:Formate dehydrogenase subunit gamma n=1 Tax=Actinoallomurus bryophytorum TaxID=1490222 RepID=A0A543CRT0_9ACTN|nr:cytochrome b/b6 domain-containing protein [Actinoallomurus bryophytorum]TQL99700.1 formate dehydrogenase subunit gamma [Actinoallomurus bryophytorum]
MIRFTRPVRWVHHATALLMLICLVTAAVLYVPALEETVGRRHLIRLIHVYAGFGLPVPALLGWASRAFRDDLRRLNRFSPADWEWLRGKDRRATVRGRGIHPVGKYNAGQKLNAAFAGGAILVMLGTGAVLTFPHRWPDSLRAGATFVHDWLFFAIFVVVAGHLYYALRDPGSLSGMFRGHVRRDWAARHHVAWLDETDEREPRDRVAGKS